MSKILKNRSVLAAIGITVALIVCLVISPAVNAAAGKQVAVVRVTETIPKGTLITKDMVQTANVGGYNLPSNTLKSVDDVVNQYALADLQPGDNILASKVSGQSPNEGLSNLDGKRQAISVTIKSFAAGLSGKLQSGDIITFYVADYGDMKETLSPAELQYVKVIATTTNKGEDYSAETKQESDKSDKSDSDDMPSTITVLVSQSQAIKLVDYEKNGTLHAALAYRGTTQNAQKFLDLEDQYITSQSAQNTTQAQAENKVAGGTKNNGK
ncbi:MAG TPA: RcpC/CpaB family pilus assembly protein [Caproicibacter sp.]|nr:RcpC/CpaB family pilus assembly protein [Caproicibacter sp.]